ncbi:ParH-like protein [Kitasatospora sp. NPDC094011]|uniref:ParH-like protein n=1 Tax=Kitasatospora sp. NPDC094011 TaxID=3364090 RepID=UPI003828709B
MAGGRRERRELWRRCRGVAEELRLPGPFDAERLVGELGARLGRPIELLPLPSRSCGPCGVLVSTDRAEYVGYPLDTTALHQQHIVLHELAHLLCHHRGRAETADPGPAVPRSLLPHLSEELVRRVLGRHGYSELEEQEAELIASLARRPAAGLRAAGLPGAGLPGGGAAGFAGEVRLDGVFGLAAPANTREE